MDEHWNLDQEIRYKKALTDKMNMVVMLQNGNCKQTGTETLLDEPMPKKMKLDECLKAETTLGEPMSEDLVCDEPMLDEHICSDDL